MGTVISLIFPGLSALAGLVWAIIIIRAWAPAAERRGGHWALEAILYICGPATTIFVALYPVDGSMTGPLPGLNRAATLAALALAVIAMIDSPRHPRRHTGGVAVGVLIFYLAFWLSAIGGVVPAFPEAYWTTPLIVLAFLFHGGYSKEWLLRTVRIALRIILVLSVGVMFLLPDMAFNLEESRTLFGLHRLQGIVTHPNGFAALAALGFLLELHARSRFYWKVLFIVGFVLAQSTTAYIAVIVGLLVMRSALSKTLRVLLYMGGMAVGFGVIFGAGPWLVSTFVPESAGTFTGRTAIWAAALRGFQMNPAFGYGPTLLDEEFRNHYLPNFEAAAQAHNQMIQTLGGEGLVGLTALAILMLVLLVAAVRSYSATGGLSVALLVFLAVRFVTETPLRPSGVGTGTLVLVVIFGLLAASQTAPGTAAKAEKALARSRPDWALRTQVGRELAAAKAVGRTTASAYLSPQPDSATVEGFTKSPGRRASTRQRS